MQEPLPIVREYERTAFKKALFCISAVLFAGVLMLAANFAESLYAFRLLYAMFGGSFLEIEWQYQLINIVLYLFLLLIPGVFLLVVFRKGFFSPFAGPLSAPRLPFLYIPMCIGALYLLNLVVNLLFGDLFAPFEDAGNSDLPMTLPGMLLYFIHLSILPALLEEWLFRGIMLRQLLPAVGKWPAVILSAFVFGLMHLNPAQSIFAFGFGIFAGYAYLSTGSIWFSALIHMVNNALSGCMGYWYALAGTEEELLPFGIYTIVMMVFGAIALACYIPYVQRRKKHTRRTNAERLLPDGKRILRAALCNPVLYLLVGAYAYLLWFFFLSLPM